MSKNPVTSGVAVDLQAIAYPATEPLLVADEKGSENISRANTQSLKQFKRKCSLRAEVLLHGNAKGGACPPFKKVKLTPFVLTPFVLILERVL